MSTKWNPIETSIGYFIYTINNELYDIIYEAEHLYILITIHISITTPTIAVETHTYPRTLSCDTIDLTQFL